jgi:hypothetical protein
MFLEVRILMELRVQFSQVRILKHLRAPPKIAKGCEASRRGKQ